MKLIRLSELGEPAAYALAAIATYIVFGDLHETGHASVCVAIGGSVGGLRHWVHGILPFTLSPATGCTITNAASAWAAGPLTSIGAWLAGALAVSILLKRVVRERTLICVHAFWIFWSMWFLLELLADTINAYAPSSARHDTTQFVHLTGINPSFVGIPLAALLVVSFWFTWRTVIGIGRVVSERQPGQTTRDSELHLR
jgi:hypothetical protein